MTRGPGREPVPVPAPVPVPVPRARRAFPFGGRGTRASYRAHPTSTAVALQVGNFVKAMLASVDALELLRLSEKAMPNSCAHRPAGTPETCTTSHSFSNVSPWALLLAYCC